MNRQLIIYILVYVGAIAAADAFTTGPVKWILMTALVILLLIGAKVLDEPRGKRKAYLEGKTIALVVVYVAFYGIVSSMVPYHWLRLLCYGIAAVALFALSNKFQTEE